MAKPGFFIKPIERQSAKSVYIPVGGDQFRALAVAIFDYMRSGNRVSDTTCKMILEYFYKYKSKYAPAEPYQTAQDRMFMLVDNTANKHEVMTAMLLVLRSIVIDEIIKNPLQYKDFFNNLEDSITVNDLYESSVVFPSRVFAAATAKALGIKITMKIVKPGKEIPATKIQDYTAEGVTNFKLVIKKNGDNYFPAVKNKAAYAYTGTKFTLKEQQEPIKSEFKTSVDDLKRLIARDNQHLLEEFHKMQHKLVFMLERKEITQEQLKWQYKTNLRLRNETCMEGASFLAQLQRHDESPQNVMDDKTNNHSDLIVDAVALQLCTQHIDADLFFDGFNSSIKQGI